MKTFLNKTMMFFGNLAINTLDFLASKSLIFLTIRQDTKWDNFVLLFRGLAYFVSAIISDYIYNDHYFNKNELWNMYVVNR